MRGTAGIFGFPFRLHATLNLPTVQGATKSGSARFRAHTPFSVRPKGTPLSPYPPFDSWPAFEWSPAAPPHHRVAPPTDLGIQFFGDAVYDAMRIDAWSPTPDLDLQTFAKRFLRLLRHISGQSWVGAYEFQTDATLKFTFPVDSAGRALETAYCNTHFISPSAWARPIDTDIYQGAFSAALGEVEPPIYWSLFHDAQNDYARDNLSVAILGLAMSIEVGRNVRFPAFAKTAIKPDIGEVLKAPFDGTDLLHHLSDALQGVHRRNLKHEHPDAWLSLKELYVARHHVAHGKPPVYRTPQGPRRADEEAYRRWVSGVFTILRWLETL